MSKFQPKRAKQRHFHTKEDIRHCLDVHCYPVLSEIIIGYLDIEDLYVESKEIFEFVIENRYPVKKLIARGYFLDLIYSPTTHLDLPAGSFHLKCYTPSTSLTMGILPMFWNITEDPTRVILARSNKQETRSQ